MKKLEEKKSRVFFSTFFPITVFSIAGCQNPGAQTSVQATYNGVAQAITLQNGVPVIDIPASIEATFRALAEAKIKCANQDSADVTTSDNKQCGPNQCAAMVSRDRNENSIRFSSTAQIKNEDGSSKIDGKLAVNFQSSKNERKEVLRCVDVAASPVFFLQSAKEILVSTSKLREEVRAREQKEIDIPRFDSTGKLIDSQSFSDRVFRCLVATGNYRSCILNPGFKDRSEDNLSQEKKSRLLGYQNKLREKLLPFCTETLGRSSTCSSEEPCRIESYETFLATSPLFSVEVFQTFAGSAAQNFGVKICNEGDEVCGQVDQNNSTGETRVQAKVKMSFGPGSDRSAFSGVTPICSSVEKHPLFQEFTAFMVNTQAYWSK
jgi:hypothetical protein